MEKEFEDELFFECDEADLGQFMKNRAEKVAKIKTVGKILAHMDNADEVFNVSTLFLSLHASITFFCFTSPVVTLLDDETPAMLLRMPMPRAPPI